MKQYIILFLILILSSCMSEKTIIRKYYTLDVPDKPVVLENMEHLPLSGSCEIQRAVINPVYEKNQIANRSKTHEVTYYMYHQWAVRPADAIQVYIYDYMRKTKLFENVFSRFSRIIPEYRILTEVNDLEVVEDNGQLSAHLNIELSLILNSDNSLIIMHKADRVEKLEQKNINLYAASISNILYEELSAFALEISRKADEIDLLQYP